MHLIFLMGYTFPGLASENGECIQMGYKFPSLASELWGMHFVSNLDTSQHSDTWIAEQQLITRYMIVDTCTCVTL